MSIVVRPAPPTPRGTLSATVHALLVGALVSQAVHVGFSMIEPRCNQTPAAVAAHYDDLDWIYRDVWGEHVHHGLWLTGEEPASVAVKQLVSLVAELGALRRGDSVCDIGCGYGATARMLAADYGARVTAITLSGAQLAYAQQQGAGDNPAYRLGDWLDNDLPGAAFDAAVAIESSEHMRDKRRFFAEAYRVLRPGGRLVVCAWLARDAPRGWEVRHLLEPICREGRLPGMGAAAEYAAWMRAEGFELLRFVDLSAQVAKTWPLCAGRLLRRLLRRADYRRFMASRRNENRVFAATIFRIWAAYAVGSMRYGVFAAQKPDAG